MSSNLDLFIPQLMGIALNLAPLKVTKWLLWFWVSHPDITSREDERASLGVMSLLELRNISQEPLATK